MRLRQFEQADPRRVSLAIELLTHARTLLVAARARRAADKVRAALRSARGAQRHIARLQFRDREGAPR